MRDQTERIRCYYNRNTRWMRLFGQGRGEAAIHRPVWLSADLSRREALHSVDNLISKALRLQEIPIQMRILDLGCGLGGSALWLAGNFSVQVTGITVSPLQRQIAQQLARRRGLQRRCRFQVADFTHLPNLDGITGAYAIESFSHGTNAEGFFAQIGHFLPSGSRLILCDDFLTSDRSITSVHQQRWLSRFQEGWHLQSLISVDQVQHLAARAGFQLVQKKNLTHYLEPTHPLLRKVQHLLGSALRKTAWGSSMYGGSALQVCQENSWTVYMFLVFEKR